MRVHLLLPAVVTVLLGCGEGAGVAPRGGGRPEPIAFEVVSFEQQGSREVARNETLSLRFSSPVDPESVGSGSVRLLGRHGETEQPVRIEVAGDRILLHPPSPFGFESRTRYRIVVEGFPSVRAPRSTGGLPLGRRFRGSFTTSRYYGSDLVPPVVESMTLREEPGAAPSLHLRFSEAIDPRSIEPGASLRVTSLDDGSELSGRLVTDREARLFRFLLSGTCGHSGIRVELTTGIQDLAGNPLKVADIDREVRTFPLTAPVPERVGFGEIVEDFSSSRMMDAGETTALWNEPISRGVLRGDRRTASLRIFGDSRAPEDHIPIGSGEVRLRFLLESAQLGPPREITGLTLHLVSPGRVDPYYHRVHVEITPTRAERLGRRELELEPPTVVYDQAELRLDRERPEVLELPLTRIFSYDGGSNLLVDIRIGEGGHTSFLRARKARAAAATWEGRPEPLRPLVTLTSFSRIPTATSLFYDTGLEAPVYLEPLTHPRAMPRDVRLELAFQGASRLGPDGRPPEDDPAAVSEWVEDVRDLSGYRYLRFRATFTGVNLTPGPPQLDDLIIPFRLR